MVPEEQENIQQLLREATEQQEKAAAVKRIHDWDKRMRRAFKGIVPRRTARAALQRSVKKHNLLEDA